MEYVRSKGYTYIHLQTPFALIDYNPDADINMVCVYRHELIRKIVNTSLLRPLEKWLFLHLKEDYEKGLTCAYQKLGETALMSAPTFVYAHLRSLRQSHLFAKSEAFDSLPETDKRKRSYALRMLHINEQLERVVDTILKRSEVDPVIVIMSDRGPTYEFLPSAKELGGHVSKGRMEIFSAFHLPRSIQKSKYQSTTPVNYFRMIFNDFLGGNFNILPDRSFYSTEQEPWNIQEVSLGDT